MRIFIVSIILLLLMGCSGAGIENKYQKEGNIYYNQGKGKIDKITITIKIPVLKTKKIEIQNNEGGE